MTIMEMLRLPWGHSLGWLGRSWKNCKLHLSRKREIAQVRSARHQPDTPSIPSIQPQKTIASIDFAMAQRAFLLQGSNISPAPKMLQQMQEQTLALSESQSNVL